MTVQKKTALIFTVITGAILLLMSIVAYFFMNVFAFQDYYKRLEIRGIITAKAKLLEQNRVDIEEIYSEIRQQHLESLPNEREYFFPADSLKSFIRANTNEDFTPEFFAQLAERKTANLKSGNYFYNGLYYYDHGTPYVVIVGAQNADAIRYARNLRWILIACFLSGTIVAYTTGIFFSRHTFKPVREITEKVKTIGVENLHMRLEDPTGEDEIAELTSTFNEMLSRLETAFETQNNFVSNASHEFRTPLTAIYGEAEIALSRPRTNDEYQHSLEVIVNQADKLQQLTDSLLNLAQTGFDGKGPKLKTVQIDELLMEVKHTINKIIPDNHVRIDLSQMPASDRYLTVSCNYQLLKLGLSNVIENGCKYSENKPVSVTLSVVDDKLQIVVKDQGIGIPAEELKYIYDPFFRASNTGKYKGYGIGLPLTRNIFRLHKGSIDVFSYGGNGTTVTLTIPYV